VGSGATLTIESQITREEKKKRDIAIKAEALLKESEKHAFCSEVDRSIVLYNLGCLYLSNLTGMAKQPITSEGLCRSFLITLMS